MEIVKIFRNLQRFFKFSQDPESVTNTQLLLEEFRAHDFFLNESQKVCKVGSWIWDVKSDKIRWSDYLVEMFGVTTKTIPKTYKEYLNFLPANERDIAHSTISAAFKEKRAFAFEHHLLNRKGEIITLDCHGKVIVENGEVKAVIGTSQDITEDKQLETILRMQKDQAEASNQAKTRFLANMSHEIRTPISAILGFAELLSDQSVPDSARNSYLSLIRANANWLTELVENILDLSKIESGKIESERIKFDLTSFLMTIRDLVGPTPTDRNPIPIEFQFVGLLPRKISTDPTRLRQILINIIRNAQKFTRNGRIVVRIRTGKQRHRPKLLFDIADTGIGMTEDQQRKVFDAFTQADSSTTRQFGGTGLGLTLSKRLANVLGGDVCIKRSRPGKGTIFRVEIPLVESNDRIQIAELPKTSFANGLEDSELLTHKNILLVDDSRDNREIIKRFLEKAGAVVETAENGQAAIEKLRKQHFDLVLMDIQMPIMDGLAATREIRKTDHNTPIVALTAHALEEEKATCLQSGFDDYLTKPINRRVLLEHVSHEIEHHLH